MKYLVGDIGNTLTKLTILNNRFKILKSKNINSNKLFNKNYLPIFFKNFLSSNLNSKIIKISEALPEDGGKGAIYIFLKKNKNL